MQITLHTAEWSALERFLSEHPTQDSEAVFEFLADDPITDALGDSMVMNGDFGTIFERCEPELDPADAASLRRFIATFCSMVNDDSPRDADLFEFYSIMSPATLRELIELPERIDRRALRALVKKAVAPGDLYLQSVGEFFDYLDTWQRAYRFAEAEGRGCAVMMG